MRNKSRNQISIVFSASILSSMLLVFSSCMTVKSSADDLPESYQKLDEQIVVAVLDIENKTKYGERRLADSAMEILTGELSRTGNFILVERNRLDDVMGEIQLQYSGMTSSDELVKLGNLLNCEYFLVGAITNFGIKTEGRDMLIVQQKFQIANTETEIRLVSVETGQILYSAFGVGEIEKKISSGAAGGGASGGYDESLAGETLRISIKSGVHELVGYLAGR